MIINAASRARLTATVTLDFDPATSTIEVAVDGTWYPATWQGVATSSSGTWKQPAITTGYFAGPLAVPAGAVVLATGRHLTQTRVTKGGDVIVAGSTRIDVL